MRHVRFGLIVVVLFLLAWFLFENHDSLNENIVLEFAPFNLTILPKAPVALWKMFLWTILSVAACTYLYGLGKQILLRSELWKRDREIRQLSAQVEDQELEIKRLKAASGEEAPLGARTAAHEPSPLKSLGDSGEEDSSEESLG